MDDGGGNGVAVDGDFGVGDGVDGGGEDVGGDGAGDGGGGDGNGSGGDGDGGGGDGGGGDRDGDNGAWPTWGSCGGASFSNTTPSTRLIQAHPHIGAQLPLPVLSLGAGVA